jgi:hypothetical protein
VNTGIERKGRTAALDLAIAPDWDAVKRTWDPSHKMLVDAGLTADEGYQLAMVTQELLENAVKYGSFRHGERLLLGIRVTSEDVVIEVKSRVGVDDAHLHSFDQRIQWIRGFQDPFEAYVERMKIVSAQPFSDGESGLGLARIAYEGRSIIDFYVDENNTLAVSAVYRRDGESAWATR